MQNNSVKILWKGIPMRPPLLKIVLNLFRIILKHLHILFPNIGKTFPNIVFVGQILNKVDD